MWSKIVILCAAFKAASTRKHSPSSCSLELSARAREGFFKEMTNGTSPIGKKQRVQSTDRLPLLRSAPKEESSWPPMKMRSPASLQN
jgi:hypothetical protein